MREVYRALLTVQATFLALWLVLGFWSLSTANQVVLSLLIALAGSVMLWWQWRQSRVGHDGACDIHNESLPPEDFQGNVILVCGEGNVFFPPGFGHRETHQGWYLQIEDPGQLPLLAQRLSCVRPALISQISLLLAVLPERHVSRDSFTQSLRSWQRAIAQSCSGFSGLPPVWMGVWVSPPSVCMNEEIIWFSTIDNQQGIHIYQSGQVNQPLADWIKDIDAAERFSRMSQALWLESLLMWLGAEVNSLLSGFQGEQPGLKLCAQAICLVPVSGLPDNHWHQHITAITALKPGVSVNTDVLPLPDFLLCGLPRRHGISRRMLFWRYVGLLGGIFLALAMLASFINNQRLIRNVGDHLSQYHHLSGEPPAPKLQAQQRLREDSQRLNDWHQRGESLGHSLGLYQGLRLRVPVEVAISGWAHPLPSPIQPSGNNIVYEQGPKTFSFDSMSLFDSGKHVLKAGSTKMLINSLMGIKAKPGWLIVVAGHTDNTGNPKLNQMLSLRRAQAVRDWIRDTGDVPESCFAVQGYGESRPIATNDTPEGRAHNRRVEISLVAQADACQRPEPPHVISG